MTSHHNIATASHDPAATAAKQPAHAHAALAYTITDASRVSGFSRTRLYQLFGEGRLTPRRAGRRTLVLASELQQLVSSLPPAPVRRRDQTEGG